MTDARPPQTYVLLPCALIFLALTAGCGENKKVQDAATEKRWKNSAAHFDAGEIDKMKAAGQAAGQKGTGAATPATPR